MSVLQNRGSVPPLLPRIVGVCTVRARLRLIEERWIYTFVLRIHVFIQNDGGEGSYVRHQSTHAYITLHLASSICHFGHRVVTLFPSLTF